MFLLIFRRALVEVGKIYGYSFLSLSLSLGFDLVLRIQVIVC